MVLGQEIDVLTSDVEGADDEVDRTARHFLDDVDGGLNRARSDLAAHVLDVRTQETVISTVESVNGRAVAEDGFETRDFVVLAALHVDFVTRADGCACARADFHRFGVAVDCNYARAAQGVVLDIGSVVNVDGHTLHQRLDAVDGETVVAAARICDRGRKQTAAVTVQHTSEIELAGFEQPVHFGVEQVDERARAVLRRTHGFVGNFDFAVQVFEGERELRVVVAAAHGQRVGLFARAYAAVDAVGREFFDLFAPYVRARLPYLGKKGIDAHVELVGEHAEIKCFQCLIRIGNGYHNVLLHLLSFRNKFPASSMLFGFFRGVTPSSPVPCITTGGLPSFNPLR